MNKTFFTTALLSISLSACANMATGNPVNQSSEQDSVPNQETTQSTASLPYPQISLQEQVDQLNVQIGQLEQKIHQLTHRIEQLEPRNHTTPKRPSRPKAITVSAPTSNPTSTKTTTPNPLSQAQQAFRAGKYQQVLSLLSEADGGGNGSNEARQSMYLLLQSHLKLGNCQSVINIGQRYAARYARQAQADEALYQVGHCQWQIQQRDIAKETWRQLVRSYPNSAAAKRAASRLK